MDHKNQKKISVTRIVTVALLLVFLVSAILLGVNLWEKYHSDYTGDGSGPSTDITHNGKDYKLRSDIETFLIMGLDKYEGQTDDGSYRNNHQADFVMLFVFDKKDSKCTALHINRDTMVDVNLLGVAGQKLDTVKKQLALSYNQGNGKEVSCRNTADSVSMLLSNIRIDHYVSVTMDSVSLFNDLVGGVELTVLDDFSAVDPTLVQGETVKLSGPQALRYVRSRHNVDDSSNQSRMKRQRQYLSALYEKTKSVSQSDDEFVIRACVEMSDYMVSDCSVNKLQSLMETFLAYDLTEIVSLEGETKMGEEFLEFYPDPDAVRQLVVDLFYSEK